MIEINLEKAQRLINEAIELKGPEFVYEPPTPAGCKYVHTTVSYDENDLLDETYHPGCIVGFALHLAGIDLDSMREVNQGCASELLHHLRNEGLLEFTADAENYLSYVQESQDKRRPWGEAADRAERGDVWAGTGYNKYVTLYGSTPAEGYGN